jgi:hypothetical protein
MGVDAVDFFCHLYSPARVITDALIRKIRRKPPEAVRRPWRSAIFKRIAILGEHGFGDAAANGDRVEGSVLRKAA